MPKRPHHATVVSYLALFFALGGTAAAATGGGFILGRANSATTVTTLTNTRGTSLSLGAAAGHAPLAVSNTVKVARLNADYLDGLDSSALQRRVTGTCPAGSAISAIGAGGAVGCVAVSTGSSGPSTPSEGTSKGWVIADQQVRTDAAGDFQAVARLTNDTGHTASAFFTITLYSGTSIVGTLSGAADSVPAGETFTVTFSSTDPSVAFDSSTFQTDTTN